MCNYQTSEAVTSGHPDKICDQIADAIVDYILTNDPYCRCGFEVLVNNAMVVVGIGHMLGVEGLPMLLEDRGYKVERVRRLDLPN